MLLQETFAIWDGDEEIELLDQQKWMDAGQSQDPWLVLFYSGRFTMVKELGEVIKKNISCVLGSGI